jgi:hypothetical protein
MSGNRPIANRSMSMNSMLGTPPNFTDTRIMRKITQIKRASMLWVTLDENPNTINDTSFLVSLDQDAWVDFPASYHNKAGGLSFADGQAEIRKWCEAPQRYSLAASAHNQPIETVKKGMRI